MKSFLSSRQIFITIFLILTVVLVACERQINQEEPVPTSETPILTPPDLLPTTDPALIPTTDPALFPTTDPALVPTTDPATITDPNAQATPAATSPVTHVVNAGETLFTIALQYGLTVEELAAANNVNQTDVLTPGQTLIVPVAGGSTTAVEPTAETPTTTTAGEQVHIVAAGENLYRIGLRYGFTVEQLATYNNIANPDRISVGQEILIPPGGNQ